MENKFEKKSTKTPQTEILENFITIQNSSLYMPSLAVGVFMFMLEHKLKFPNNKGPSRNLIAQAVALAGFKKFDEGHITKTESSPCKILLNLGLIYRKEDMRKSSYKVIDQYKEKLAELQTLTLNDKNRELIRSVHHINLQQLATPLIQHYENNSYASKRYSPAFFSSQPILNNEVKNSQASSEFNHLVANSEQIMIRTQSEQLRTKDQEIEHLKRIIEQQRERIAMLEQMTFEQNKDLIDSLTDLSSSDRMAKRQKTSFSS